MGACIGVGLGLWQLHYVLTDQSEGTSLHATRAELIDPTTLHDVLNSFELRRQYFDEVRGAQTERSATSSTASSTKPKR